MDVAIGVDAVDSGGKLVAQVGRDRVVLGSASKGDDADTVASLSAKSLHAHRI